MHKKPRRAVFRPLFAFLAVFVGLVLVGPISPANASVDKVGVCHRTASETNPYVLINVPQDQAEGHITGTNKQHNHKVYWDSAGTWDGIEHAAGDERMDYYASDGISGNCTNGEQPPPPESNDASFETSVSDATCGVGEVLTYSGANVTFEGPASPVTGPATDVEVLATPESGHGWSSEGSGGTRIVFEGDLAGPLTGQQCEEQPDPIVETVPHSEESCEIGGVHTWDVVTTTTFTWDEEAGEYVGTTEETVENDTVTPYTTQEAEDLGCIEVEGEQGHGGHGHHGGGTKGDPEVKGEQATVPTEVEAGLAGGPAPAGGSSLPLWALSLGAGLFLTGAGRLRRTGYTGRHVR